MTVLPVGSVVDYSYPEKHKAARLVVVAHSFDQHGGDPLMMLAEQPIAPPKDAKLYSPASMIYGVIAGWTAGHVDACMVRDTGERCKVAPFETTEEWCQFRGLVWDGDVWRKADARRN